MKIVQQIKNALENVEMRHKIKPKMKQN